MLNVEGRRIAILGGTTGIGLATARLLTGRGAEVTVGGRDEGRLQEARTQLANGARAVQVDATDANRCASSSAQPMRSTTWSSR